MSEQVGSWFDALFGDVAVNAEQWHRAIYGDGDRKPWECPRCGKVHAPWVEHCDCKPRQDSASVGPSEFK